MRLFRSLIFILAVISTLFAEPITITVAGTGLTGIWTAYSICKDLELENKGDAVRLILLGKWDWEKELNEASNKELALFTHETSGFGPIGIQPHSGLLWNTDNEVVDLVKRGIGNKTASFYTSEDLEDEGKEFLELYVGWHGRHPDQENDPASSYQRQKALIEINRYARALWQKFADQHPPIDLHLEGAFRVYDNPLHFANALKSLEILKTFNYPAEAIHDPQALADRLPFYQETILRDQSQGIFFPDDGLIDSNQLRRFLWSYLTEKREGKPEIVIRSDGEISGFNIDSEGNCRGLFLRNGETIDSDITILATGLANRSLLSQLGFELPLWSIWGAAVRAPLVEKENAPKGGVSFHSERCITASTDGRTITVAGMSLVIPAGTTPDEEMVRNKLTQNLSAIFGNRVDHKSLRFAIAPRTGIPDDLPIIGLHVEGINHLIVLNPTSHLGNTQSIALGKIASIEVQRKIGVNRAYPSAINLFNYRLDRFREDVKRVRL